MKMKDGRRRKKRPKKFFARVNLGFRKNFGFSKQTLSFRKVHKGTHDRRSYPARARALRADSEETQNVRTKKKFPALSGVLISRDDARFLVLICLLFFFFFSFLCLETKTLSNWKRKEKNYQAR